ncbi:MAG: hypothetical protein CMK09_10435 [Ponticaulis sp.]|nr:hypothetical protein [Ponticaulis sp.]|tara:strand:+ start:16328 stop:16828 length:501 start_codon:yes stop_codon:yes gene_type:complete
MALFKSSRSLALAVGLGGMVALSGCAGGYGATERTASGVGQTATVREGIVISSEAVTIRPDRNYLGAATGAVLGGIAGSNVGGGDDERAAGAVAGAVLGGVLGNEVSKGVNTRQGIAYIIDFGNGKIQEIVQGADVVIAPGTPVYVSFGTDRVRVWPKTQGYPQSY